MAPSRPLVRTTATVRLNVIVRTATLSAIRAPAAQGLESKTTLPAHQKCGSLLKGAASSSCFSWGAADIHWKIYVGIQKTANMSNEAYFTGVFGVLATLLGVVVTYLLSFSLDRRKDRAKHLAGLRAIQRETERVFDLQQERAYPSLRGIESLALIFDFSVCLPELTVALGNFQALSERINKATENQRDLIDSLLASGDLARLGRDGTPLGLSIDEYPRERDRLILEQEAEMFNLRRQLSLEMNRRT